MSASIASLEYQQSRIEFVERLRHFEKRKRSLLGSQCRDNPSSLARQPLGFKQSLPQGWVEIRAGMPGMSPP
jgi:hypothetical protein